MNRDWFNVTDEEIERVKSYIIDTTKGYYYNDFNKCDGSYMLEDWDVLYKIEKLIQKEYQWVDWNTYVEQRCVILNNYFENKYPLDRIKKNLNILTGYLRSYQPKIGVYCGSFNPFHIGHLDVLKQAENVFDKVIIARGVNDNKNNISFDSYEYFPKSLQYHQIENYAGLLSEYLKNFKYPVTLIRGLRNGHDLLDETNLRTWLNLDNVVYFVCDKKYEHVSSSSIRSLRDKYPTLVREYIVK